MYANWRSRNKRKEAKDGVAEHRCRVSGEGIRDKGNIFPHPYRALLIFGLTDQIADGIPERREGGRLLTFGMAEGILDQIP
jgi:hypothetical protein